MQGVGWDLKAQNLIPNANCWKRISIFLSSVTLHVVRNNRIDQKASPTYIEGDEGKLELGTLCCRLLLARRLNLQILPNSCLLGLFLQLLISDCLRERWSTFLRCILSFYSHYNRPESRSSVQLQEHQAGRSRIAKMLTDSESFTPGYNMHSSKWHFWYQRLTLHKWGKQICMWILVLMCLCLPRLPWINISANFPIFIHPQN